MPGKVVVPQGEAEVIVEAEAIRRSRGKVANEDKFKFRLAESGLPGSIMWNAQPWKIKTWTLEEK